VASATSAARLGEHAAIERRVDGAPRLGPQQREPGGVEHLDREPPADLHLARVLGSKAVSTPGRRSPPSSARRPSRAPRAAPSGVTTLPFDFDIFLRSGSSTQPEIAALVHGSDVVLEMRAQHGREQPGADDVVRLRPQVHREDAGEQVGSSSQPPAICGVSDEVAQVSITSGSP
jgi:hypothetical protein